MRKSAGERAGGTGERRTERRRRGVAEEQGVPQATPADGFAADDRIDEHAERGRGAHERRHHEDLRCEDDGGRVREERTRREGAEEEDANLDASLAKRERLVHADIRAVEDHPLSGAILA